MNDETKPNQPRPCVTRLPIEFRGINLRARLKDPDGWPKYGKVALTSDYIFELRKGDGEWIDLETLGLGVTDITLRFPACAIPEIQITAIEGYAKTPIVSSEELEAIWRTP